MQKFFKVLTLTRNILRQRLRQKSPDPRFDPQFTWLFREPNMAFPKEVQLLHF